MGDGHYGAGELHQEVFQPGDRLGVQVVGRLVQQQHVGAGEQQSADGHAAALATRQMRHRGVPFRQAQRVGGDFQHAIQLPAGGKFDRLLQFSLFGQQFVHPLVVHRFGELHADLVETSQEPAHFGYPFLDHLANGLAGIKLRLLWQITNANSGLRPRLAIVLRIHPGHDAQHGRLPGAIEPEQANFCARKEGQRDVFNDGAVRRHGLADADHRVNILGHGEFRVMYEAIFRRKPLIPGAHYA